MRHEVHAGRDRPSVHPGFTLQKLRGGPSRAVVPDVRGGRVSELHGCNPWRDDSATPHPGSCLRSVEDPRLPKCPEHGEVLRYMCLTCDVVSCTDCMNFGLHKGHVHELVTAVADGHRSQLQEHVRAAEAAEVARAHRCVCSPIVLHVCVHGTDMCVAIWVQALRKTTLPNCGGICKVFPDV